MGIAVCQSKKNCIQINFYETLYNGTFFRSIVATGSED